MSQPFGLSCKGGLNTNLNQLEMLAQPGFAVKLRNFEVDPDGGYRRINGFVPFGGSSSTRPETNEVIQGIYPYGLGIVVCAGTSVYYSEDGISWTQINYDTGHTGVLEDDLSAETELDRPTQGQAQFVLMRASAGHVTNPYGTLTIATGADKIAHFHIDGQGATRKFVYQEISTPAAGTYIEEHDKHLCVVDSINAPNTVYYSKTNDDTDFSGTGSGAIRLADKIVGIKSFRETLYIFCENTIHKLVNINDPSTLQVIQVTKNVGCLSGYSIQEIGGDLLYLAPDGIRTIAATDRIGDVELSSVSRNIQKIISDIASSINTYRITSCVLRNKSQYRLFYSSLTEGSLTSKGLIGTFTGSGFEWSETLGIQAFGLVSDFNASGVEVKFHGDKDGYVYLHDEGKAFYPADVETPIDAEYQTPNLDFGDIGTRKTIKYGRISFSPEGTASPTLRVRYDFDDPTIPQPNDYQLNDIPLPAIFGNVAFGIATFGATNDPMVRQTIEGSGNTVNFRIKSNDTNSPYVVNGIYIDYTPSGRR